MIRDITSFFILSSLLITTGCTQHPDIYFYCDRDRVGDYVLKWEVSPTVPEDKIKIYMSDNDSVFAEPPIMETMVSDYVAQIPKQDSITRKFFRLKVNKTFSGIISNHAFKMDNMQNLRDLGGYFTKEKKQVKWGKIFRSGDLSEITSRDHKIIESLGIKTIIDFRGVEEYTNSPDLYTATNMYHLPIASGNRSYIRDKILNGTFYRGDAILFTQDMYKTMIEKYPEEYARFFDILSDKNNYPILYHGFLGKDRTGLASYFLLRALGISDDANEDDYMMSNLYISEQMVMGEARYLPEQMQEAATVVCKADIRYLKYAISCMKKKSGSVDKYMEKELKLTEAKKQKLREILLYK